MADFQEKLYPLAAMCQAAQLALQLSTGGTCDTAALKTQIDSLFVMDPKRVNHVYQGLKSLKLGLGYLHMASASPLKAVKGLTLRLILSFLVLAKKILRSKSVQNKMRIQLQRIHEQIDYFGTYDHPRIMHNLSELYVETASSFQLQLKIFGQKKYLQNIETLDQIRAILLTGVRAAVLWYQLKGNFLWLLWQRKALMEKAKEILQA